MRLHFRFEWDSAKAASNLRRHGVSFDDAARVLGQAEGDYYLIEEFDDAHSEQEDRYRTFGSHPEDRTIVLQISWTERESKTGPVTRVISARAASPRQRKEYAERIRRKNRSQDD